MLMQLLVLLLLLLSPERDGGVCGDDTAPDVSTAGLPQARPPAPHVTDLHNSGTLTAVAALEESTVDTTVSTTASSRLSQHST